MISDRYKFIFIHINKTGGTSIEKFFDPFADQRDVERKHAKVRFYKRNYPNKFREYFKFAFVRNPWDWLVSRYHWSKEHQDLFDFSFAEFIRRLDHGIPLSDQAEWLENIALRPQIDRLTVDGQIAVDFIGRFENLQGDFNEICARLGIRAGILENVFKTAHRRYTEYYDDEQRSIVERLYAADIAAFDYRYDDRRNELPPIGAIVQRGIDVASTRRRATTLRLAERGASNAWWSWATSILSLLPEVIWHRKPSLMRRRMSSNARHQVPSMSSVSPATRSFGSARFLARTVSTSTVRR